MGGGEDVDQNQGGDCSAHRRQQGGRDYAQAAHGSCHHVGYKSHKGHSCQDIGQGDGKAVDEGQGDDGGNHCSPHIDGQKRAAAHIAQHRYPVGYAEGPHIPILHDGHCALEVFYRDVDIASEKRCQQHK